MDLSTNETYDLTEHDFSILVRVKIDWEKMIAGTPTHEGGIVAKNGRHCGLSAFKVYQWYRYLYKSPILDMGSIREVGEIEFRDVWFDVEDNRSEFMDISYVT